MSDLVICKLSDCSCTVAGGKEIILLCEKVAKGKDILMMYGHQLFYFFLTYSHLLVFRWWSRYLYLLNLSVYFVLMFKSSAAVVFVFVFVVVIIVVIIIFCRILLYLLKHYT